MFVRNSILRELRRSLFQTVSVNVAPAHVAQTEERHEVMYHYLLQSQRCLLAVVMPSHGHLAVLV